MIPAEFDARVIKFRKDAYDAVIVDVAGWDGKERIIQVLQPERFCNMRQKLRSMIVAPKGKLLVSCDLSMAETWVVAGLANDTNMKQFLMESDIHMETGAYFFNKRGKFINPDGVGEVIVEERYIGKQNNHANSFGMGAERQAQVINKRSDQPPYVVVTVSQCKDYQRDWHGLYPNVRQVYHTDIVAQLSKNMTLITPYGRRRVFFAQWGKELWKAAYAHIPQSTVSDHFHGMVHPEYGIEGGLRGIYKNIVLPSNGEINLINDSHDSAMLEVPAGVALEIGERVRKELKRPLVVNGWEMTIPVDVECGPRWGELSKVPDPNKS